MACASRPTACSAWRSLPGDRGELPVRVLTDRSFQPPTFLVLGLDEPLAGGLQFGRLSGEEGQPRLQLDREARVVQGLTVRNPETAQSAGCLWMFPLAFASAAFAPAASMPGWLQPIVEANPITALTEALRALTTGGPAIGPVLPLETDALARWAGMT